MRRLLCLAMTVLLLAGCQGGGAASSAPPPASSQPEQPVLPPDSEISVREVVEWLSDETHHQFKIDWPDDLWVTMELLPGQRDWEREIRVDIWDPNNLDEPVQTIFDYIEEQMFGITQVVDANFDGHQDFGYMHHMGNQPSYWNFWLWDESSGCFAAEPGLSEISSPVFDSAAETISGFARDGWAGLAGTSTIHRWIDGQLTCVRRMVSAPADAGGETFLFVVEDWVDGRLKEVFRKEIPILNEGIIFDLREKWEDPFYTGEQ